MQRLSYLGYIILGIAGTVHGMALPLLISEFNISLSTAGILFFASACGYLAASIAFPFLNKRYGSGQLLALAFLIVSVTYTAFPLFSFWFALVFMGFLASIGTGTIDVGFNTLISSLEPRLAQPALNWLHFAYSVGALVGPILLSRLLDWGCSWTALYYTTGFFALIFLFLWRGFLKTADTQGEVMTPVKEHSSEIYKNLHYWLLLTIIFLYVATEVALSGWIPTLLTSEEIPVSLASLGISVIWLGIALGRALSARAVRLFAPKKLLLILSGGSSLAIFLLIPTQPLWLVFFVLFGCGLFFSAIFPLVMLQGTLLFPTAVASCASGLVVAGSIGGMVGPSLLGFIGQYYSLEAGIVFLAFLMLLSTLIALMIPGERAGYSNLAATRQDSTQESKRR